MVILILIGQNEKGLDVIVASVALSYLRQIIGRKDLL